MHNPMQHSDFQIGKDFYTAIGLWRCTDVGQRTITAVRWPEDVEIPAGSVENWLKGPPYILDEKVFDEKDMSLAYRSVKEAVERATQSSHPGFSQEAARKMMRATQRHLERRIKGEPAMAIDPVMKSLCRYERIVDGRVFHAYDWSEDGTMVHVLDIYEDTWEEIPLVHFLISPVAGEEDYAARKPEAPENQG